MSIPVYYRQCSIKEAFEKFQLFNPQVNCCRTTFYKFKPKNVKKGKSKQDCCPICKEAKAILPALEQMHSSQLSSKDRDAMSAYIFHKQVAASRASEFERSLNDLSPGTALLVMDFKSNITLGKGQEEDSHVFFKAPQRTVFGVVGYFNKNGVVFKVIFTLISSILNHDSKTVKEFLNGFVFNHGLFKFFGVKNVSIWMDNAPSQFRSYENLATLYSLQTDHGFNMSVIFFTECHGKSECDRHFGFTSRVYTD